MTMRMYARRKGWEYGATVVRLRHSRVHAADCADCETSSGMVDHIDREIVMDPALTAQQGPPCCPLPTDARYIAP